MSSTTPTAFPALSLKELVGEDTLRVVPEPILVAAVAFTGIRRDEGKPNFGDRLAFNALRSLLHASSASMALNSRMKASLLGPRRERNCIYPPFDMAGGSECSCIGTAGRGERAASPSRSYATAALQMCASTRLISFKCNQILRT